MTTMTNYAAEVTRLMDAAYPEANYPESFETDVAACFARRISAEEAAERLMADYWHEPTYHVAFVLESTGEFERVEEFAAADDAAANAYAEEHYAGKEWYVLDANGNNINV
jgi:hypothetical protein